MRTKRFAELVEDHQQELYRYAFRMMGNAEDASDVLQEAFLRALKAFPKLPPDAAHRPWLYRITSRVALNIFRSRKVRDTWPLEENTLPPADGANAEDQLEQKRSAQVLMRALGALPAKQRASVLLRKYEGLRYAEIATTLAISEDSARANVYQAMKKLRQRAQEEEATT